VKVLIALSPPGTPARRGRLCDGVELEQEVLYELLDRRCGSRRLVALGARQRLLAVLIGEIELREPDRDDRGDNEGDDDCGVFPDQSPVGYRYTSSARMIIC